MRWLRQLLARARKRKAEKDAAFQRRVRDLV
jgi:hypothetical protein